MEPQSAPTNPPPARRAASRHGLWAAGVGLLFVVLKLLPYWTTVASQPDSLFLGFPYSVEDTLQYADLVAQARDGSFFFSNHYCSPVIKTENIKFMLGTSCNNNSIKFLIAYFI